MLFNTMASYIRLPTVVVQLKTTSDVVAVQDEANADWCKRAYDILKMHERRESIIKTVRNQVAMMMEMVAMDKSFHTLPFEYRVAMRTPVIHVDFIVQCS